MADRNDDFVMVKLTEAGTRQAAAGQDVALPQGHSHTDPSVRVMAGPSIDGFTFRPGESVRVTRAFDWEQVLRPITTTDGQPMFELVTNSNAPAPEHQ